MIMTPFACKQYHSRLLPVHRGQSQSMQMSIYWCVSAHHTIMYDAAVHPSPNTQMHASQRTRAHHMNPPSGPRPRAWGPVKKGGLPWLSAGVAHSRRRMR